MPRNVPESIADCPTQRFMLTNAFVRRLFNEAEIAEQVQEIEHVERRQRVRELAIQIALWSL